MKLISKYNRINIVLIVLVFLMSSLVLNYFVKQTLIDELDEVLLEIKARAANFILKTQTIPNSTTLDDYKISFEPDKEIMPEEVFKTTAHINTEKNKIQNFRELTYTTLIGRQRYKVKIEKPIEGMRQMVANISNLSIITIFIVISFLVIVNRFVLAHLWRPFYKSMDVMANFQINKHNQNDFPATSTDEFNFMNDILKRSTQKAEADYLALKEFTENASHELQTPLAIINSKLDLLIQDENLSEKQEEKIRSAYTALKRISQLNQSLLLLTKIGNLQFSDTSTISFKNKLEEKLDQFKELWEEQIAVRADLNESLIRMNKDLMDALINNLLSNATKHNIVNGFIDIKLSQGELIIQNSGSDLALDGKKIFQRFYKAEQNSRGNGLGLSIIKQICDTSGISIKYFFTPGSHNFVLSWDPNQLTNDTIN